MQKNAANAYGLAIPPQNTKYGDIAISMQKGKDFLPATKYRARGVRLDAIIIGIRKPRSVDMLNRL